jgi:L-alanine-DL-glutamate epimerase-like enolase superfamily enzyme
MSKASNDIFSTLRTYISKVTEGERTPAEVAAAVNSWARESADALKAKIHEEVEARRVRSFSSTSCSAER